MSTQRSKSYVQGTMLPDAKSPLNRDVRGIVTRAELRDLAESIVFTDGSSGSGGVGATQAEIDRVCDVSARLVNCTASTLTLDAATHDGKIVTLNRAAGIAVTLPAASGSGSRFQLFVGTTVTSNSTTVKVANASDTMVGFVDQFADGGNTANNYEIAGTDDTITMDGSTKGGIKGDFVELIDIATNLWFVRVKQSATGTEASPMSATV